MRGGGKTSEAASPPPLHRRSAQACVLAPSSPYRRALLALGTQALGLDPSPASDGWRPEQRLCQLHRTWRHSDGRWGRHESPPCTFLPEQKHLEGSGHPSAIPSAKVGENACGFSMSPPRSSLDGHLPGSPWPSNGLLPPYSLILGGPSLWLSTPASHPRYGSFLHSSPSKLLYFILSHQ